MASRSKPSTLHGRNVVPSSFASFLQYGENLPLPSASSGIVARTGLGLGRHLHSRRAVYLLALRRGVRDFRLIIVGIAVGALLSSVNTWFSVKADVDTALRAPVAQRRMRRLELGDDAAAMLGVPVPASRCRPAR